MINKEGKESIKAFFKNVGNKIWDLDPSLKTAYSVLFVGVAIIVVTFIILSRTLGECQEIEGVVVGHQTEAGGRSLALVPDGNGGTHQVWTSNPPRYEFVVALENGQEVEAITQPDAYNFVRDGDPVVVCELFGESSGIVYGYAFDRVKHE